jgi:WD40 repeat protein
LKKHESWLIPCRDFDGRRVMGDGKSSLPSCRETTNLIFGRSFLKTRRALQEPIKMIAGTSTDQASITSRDVLPKRKQVPGYRMFCLALSSDGSIIAIAGEDGRIFVGPSDTSQKPFYSMAWSGSIEKMVFTNGDEHLLTFSNDGAICAWNIGDRTIARNVRTAHGKGVYAACFSPDHAELFTGGLDGWVRGWHPTTFEMMREIKATRHGVLSILPFNDGDRAFLASGNVDGTITIINLDDQEIVHSLPAHDGPVFCLKAFGNQNFISAGNDDYLKLWQVGSDAPLLEVHAGQGKVLDALLLHDDEIAFNFATAGGDGSIVTWNLDIASRACQYLARLPAHERTVEQLVLDPAGSAFYSLSSDGNVKRWTM